MYIVTMMNKIRHLLGTKEQHSFRLASQIEALFETLPRRGCTQENRCHTCTNQAQSKLHAAKAWRTIGYILQGRFIHYKKNSLLTALVSKLVKH